NRRVVAVACEATKEEAGRALRVEDARLAGIGERSAVGERLRAPRAERRQHRLPDDRAVRTPTTAAAAHSVTEVLVDGAQGDVSERYLVRASRGAAFHDLRIYHAAHVRKAQARNRMTVHLHACVAYRGHVAEPFDRRQAEIAARARRRRRRI